MSADLRAHAPATERNRDAILAVLRRVLPTGVDSPQAGGPSTRAPVLEIGSGTGEHIVYFARHFPQLTWQPTEAESPGLASIRAWMAHSGATNILPPVVLDANVMPWPAPSATAILAINVIHYSPWETTGALLGGAASTLADGGVLYLYGPYRRNGVHTAPSNLAFDGWLKARNETFGVRDLEAVTALANDHGLELEQVIDMPANNLSLVFRKRA